MADAFKESVKQHQRREWCVTGTKDAYKKLVHDAWASDIASTDPRPAKRALCRAMGIDVGDTDLVIAAAEGKDQLCGLSLSDLIDPATKKISCDFLQANGHGQLYDASTLRNMPSPETNGHTIKYITQMKGEERYKLATCLAEYGIFSERPPGDGKTLTVGGWVYTRDEQKDRHKWADPYIAVRVRVPWAEDKSKRALMVKVELGDGTDELIQRVFRALGMKGVAYANEVLSLVDANLKKVKTLSSKLKQPLTLLHTKQQ